MLYFAPSLSRTARFRCSHSAAQGLALLEKGDGSLVYQVSLPGTAEAVLAILCGDAAKVTDDAGKLKSYIHSIDKLSSFSSLAASVRLVCS